MSQIMKVPFFALFDPVYRHGLTDKVITMLHTKFHEKVQGVLM